MDTGCRMRFANCRVELGISKKFYKYQIPNAQNCYSFIRIMVYPKAETGLVITLWKPGRV
jgi:hypothetical protein